jgi:hypothetical protein
LLALLMEDRRLLGVLSVVFGAAALIFGVGTAHADNTGASTYCTDGYPVGSPGETGVPGTGLSFETAVGASGRNWVGVCYSTTPNGSPEPEVTGGRVFVYGPDEFSRYRVLCQGDRTTSQTVVVDCDVIVKPTDPTSAPGTTVTGSVKVGAIGPVNVGQTGAEVNPVTSTDLPGSGALGTTGGSLGVGSGTCAWVNSASPMCPFGTSGVTIAGVTVHEGDLPTATTTNTTPPPACTGINGTCPGAYIIVGGDSTNPTVVADLIVVGRQTHNVPKNCVQVNSFCPS